MFRKHSVLVFFRVQAAIRAHPWR